MRVRIAAVVSDLRTMPDTPKCSVDGCLNGTNPDFDGFVCCADAWSVFCDSQNERLFAPERQPNPRRGQKDLMLIRYGYELTLNCPRPTTMVCLLDAHRERLRDLRYETRLMTMPEIATSTYLDTFGNTVRRFIAPAGDLTLSRDAVIEDSGVPDAIEEDAKEGPVEQLPNDTLVFLLGSRFARPTSSRTSPGSYSDPSRLAGDGFRRFAISSATA